MSSDDDSIYGGTTCVFWNLEDFPVPVGRCVKSLRTNIEQALNREGYSGGVQKMFAYGSSYIRNAVMNHFFTTKIYIIDTEQTEIGRLVAMSRDMIRFARQVRPAHKLNLIVIAEDIPEEETEFVSVLQALRKLKFNVFLVVPDGYKGEVPPLNTVSKVWKWTDLFDGKPPYRKCSDDDKIDRDADEDKKF